MNAQYYRAVPSGHHAGLSGQYVVPYIHDRKQFGQAIGEFQLNAGQKWLICTPT